jgi:hypothetical protein
MTNRFACGALRRVALLLKPVALLLIVAVGASNAAAQTVDFSIGSKEVIYSKKQRGSKKLSTWPDGSFGVLNNGNGTYSFYGANGTSPVRTTGTLENPGTAKQSVKIHNLPSKTFNYVSGGPMFVDPDSGKKLMLYHAEKHGKSAKDYFSVLGLAAAFDDSGLNFWDLGTIIEPNISKSQAPFSVDIGGGSFVLKDGYLNVYYRDYMIDGSSAELAVARTSLSDLMTNIATEQEISFSKYYNGDWTEPGRGGRASALEVGNPANMWSSVSYNNHIDKMVMVSAQWTPTFADLYLATSSDGINWSPRQALDVSPSEQFYPTIVGIGDNPNESDKAFWVYYTDSKKGAWNRWKDAALVRMPVVFDDVGSPGDPIPDPNPDPPTDPVEFDWNRVSDYRDDLQGGMPADGWRYAWNPTATLGDSTKFVDLKWSELEGVYNTTGGATTVPEKYKKKRKWYTTTHPDDYLHLQLDGEGHPGNPGFMPVIGYTIQEEDGDGLYRITESMISKIDGIASKYEDGLQLQVYVNDTPLGASTSVLMNGALASFNRELGELNVGDTIWLAISGLGSQLNDAFTNLDFSIERGVELEMMALMAEGGGGIMGAAVPEPASLVMLLTVVYGYAVRRPRRNR